MMKYALLMCLSLSLVCVACPFGIGSFGPYPPTVALAGASLADYIAVLPDLSDITGGAGMMGGIGDLLNNAPDGLPAQQ